MAKTNNGPGSAQGKGRSASGRAEPKGTDKSSTKTASKAKGKGGSKSGSRVGRYTPAHQSGKYTAPIPKNVRRSPAWFGVTILALMILGVLTILLNYLSVLPYSVSSWYLVVGLLMIFAGFLMATRYR